MSGNINKSRETAQDLKNSVNMGSIRIARDVTKQKRMEEELLQGKKFLEGIFNGIQEQRWNSLRKSL